MNSGEAIDELQPGHVVAGRYRIVGALGRGGFGAVYEAEHVTLKRLVALKVLLPALAGNAEVVQRFMREARSAASIGHPGIVEVFDLGSDEGVAFLAMEKLEGEELFDRIQREHPLAPNLVARIGMDLADAIATAHEHGIIHRDLKPQNVFLARKGRRRDIVKVLDFGIAKLAEAERADTPLTRTGQIFGTPLYMSPEQLRAAKDLDGRADVYAIGAILYESLAGHPPFSAETYSELVLKVATEEPPPLASLRSDVPPALIAIVQRAMHKDRDQRTESAKALADALEAFLEDPARELAAKPLPTGAPRASQPNPFAETMQSGDHGDATKSGGALLAETPFASSSLRPPAPRRSSVPWLVALVALLAIGGGATAMLIGGGGSSASPPEIVAEAPELAGAARGTAPVEPEVPAAEPDAGVAAPEPVVRDVRFEAKPRQVQVFLGDRLVCETPCEAELEDADTTLEFRRPGYHTEERELSAPLPPSVRIELRRARRATTDQPRPGGATEEPAPPPLRER